MKCIAITKVRLPIPDYKNFIRFEDREKVCNGEMIEVGKIDNQGLGLGTQTLYQCDICGRCKLV